MRGEKGTSTATGLGGVDYMHCRLCIRTVHAIDSTLDVVNMVRVNSICCATINTETT